MAARRSNRIGWAAALAGVLLVGQALVRSAPGSPAAATTAVAALPDRLSDAEFWALQTEISEPGGYFRITDNYTSNEGEIGRLFGELRATGVQGGVYLGVGPEQNLTYIAAIRPAMAFIVDIRRQAVMQHLMFKAIFELSNDRADFISLLFAKPRPTAAAKTKSIQELWQAYIPVRSDVDMAAKTYARIVGLLTRTRRFTLTEEELTQLSSVYEAFVAYGPSISTRGPGGGFGGNNFTFVDLTGWSLDLTGEPQSFLSTEENFRVVKSLHERNLIVPVSGDFGGARALRGIGSYLRKEGAVVSAFYVSNVEQYLFQDGKHGAFYQNVAALPLDARSVFIRPYSLRRGVWPRPLCPMSQFIAAVDAGRIFSNSDALSCGRL
jgi:hypothetical protein